MLCEICGFSNPDGASICGHCEQPLGPPHAHQQPPGGQQKPHDPQLHGGQQKPYDPQPPSGQPSSLQSIPAQPYRQNYYSQNSQKQKHQGENTANASLICGVIGLSMSLFFLVFISGLAAGSIAGFIPGIVAISLGRKAKALGYTGGRATAGIILGIPAVILGAIAIVYVVVIILTLVLAYADGKNVM